MSWTAPTIADFKTFFARDFNFAPTEDPDNLDYIVDADITKALLEAQIHFNTELFGSDANITAVFMYLVAFYLVFNIQNSSKGLSSQAKFPVNSSSAGGVSVSYTIPEKYLKNPYINMLAQNGYGMKYLSFALPMIVGNVSIAEGTTTVM